MKPLLGALGRTGIETLTNVVDHIRLEGISVSSWVELTGEAVAKLAERCKTFLSEVQVTGIREAFAQRVSEVTQAMRERLQTATFVQALEVNGVAISGEVIRGLDKLLAGLEGKMSREALAH